MRLVRFIQYLLRQRRHERELAEEIESHRQMLEDHQRAAGLSEQDARHAAHRAIGNATLAREDARGVWIATWLQSVFQDLGYAARSLRSQPGFTVLALLALGLGIGVNTSLFTLLNASVPLTWAVRDPGRVVMVSNGGGGFSLAEYRYLSAHTHALAGLAIESTDFMSLDGEDALIDFAGANYFTLLGADMALGRGFAAVEDRMEAPEAVAVLGYRTWRTRYGGDPGILGRRIRVNDAPFTVIGVVNREFSPRAGPGLWVPLVSRPLVDGAAKVGSASANPSFDMLGRLAPGVSRGQARAELNILSRQFQNDARQPSRDITLRGVTRLDQFRTGLDLASAVLFAAFGSILLLACANVSNLLLARSAARQREIAVRVCIGAGRARIVRQLLTESLLLAAIGSGLGLLLAYVLSALFVRRFGNLPTRDLTPDLTVLAYAIAVAVFSAALFGLAPALQATRTGVSEAMRQQGAHASPRFPLARRSARCAGGHQRNVVAGGRIADPRTLACPLRRSRIQDQRHYDAQLELAEGLRCEAQVRPFRLRRATDATVWPRGDWISPSVHGPRVARHADGREDHRCEAGLLRVCGCRLLRCPGNSDCRGAQLRSG
jgi:hypothetical protein